MCALPGSRRGLVTVNRWSTQVELELEKGERREGKVMRLCIFRCASVWCV